MPNRLSIDRANMGHRYLVIGIFLLPFVGRITLKAHCYNLSK
jgi:hypothetical protein